MAYRIVSLFSGCGGLDLGFSGGFDFLGRRFGRLDTDIVFANDYDNDACVCYNTNIPALDNSAECFFGDIRDIESSEIPDFDILLAGFPCQPFSNAGNRKGVCDNNGRGVLFEECERVIRDKSENGMRPKAFLFENVKGIMSSKMPDGETTVPHEITRRMGLLGYDVSMRVVCSSDYGVPQKRYRLLITGIDKSLGKGCFDFGIMDDVVSEYGIPSTLSGNDEELLLGYVLKDAGGASDNDVWEFSPATQRTVELIGGCEHGRDAIGLFRNGYSKKDLPDIVFKGKSWKDIPYERLSERFRKIADNPEKYHSPKFFRRFAFGEINGTITASAQPENCGVTHPVENRRYSVREVARIQSFPDTFRFGSIPLKSRYKVIGNAVPPVMAWVVANSLLRFLSE